MKPFHPEHSGPRLHLQFYGSYAFGKSSLEAIYSAVRDFLGQPESPSPSARITVVMTGEPSLQLDSVNQLCELRNSNSSPIRTVLLAAAAPHRRVFIAIDDTGHVDCCSLLVEATATDMTSLENLEKRVRDEERNTARYFSILRRWIDEMGAKTRRTPPWAWKVIGAVAFIAMVLAIIDYVVRSIARLKIRTKALETLTQAGELPNESILSTDQIRQLIEQNSIASLFAWPILMIVSCFVGYFGPRLIEYLIPRVEFLIGDGTVRHSSRNQARTFAVGTILISGVLLPIFRSIVGFS